MREAASTQGFEITDRVVILTGGAGLLGSSWAHELSAAGAHVVVADRDGERATTVATTAPGARAVAVPVDLANPTEIRRLVTAARDEFGRIDAVVNAAAIDPKFDPESAATHTHSFTDFPLDAWQQALAVNLTAPFLLAQAAMPHLIEQCGTIVNIASTYGLVAPDQRLYEDATGTRGFKPPSYPVTKAGLLGLTRYLAAYCGPLGVRVNALAPGGVWAGHDDGFVLRYAWRTPLGRMADRDEYGRALRFLLSPGASYMTGACLVIDGGWTAW